MKKNVLAILGGMGPYASLEFNKKIFDLTPAKKDWEHIHTILDSDISIPSRTRHILYNEEDPTPYIVKSINNLAKFGAKAVVLPCNSVHYFYDKVADNIDIPWLNMLEIVANEIKKKNLKKTLILGGYVTVTKKTYDSYLKETLYLKENENRIVYELIEAVKINDLDRVEKLAEILIGIFENYDNDSILFGCTELAISKKLQNYSKKEIFDSNELYAQYAVKYMMERE